MTIRIWEFALFVFGALFTLLFFVAGSPLLGVGVGSGVAVGLAARMRPLGRRGIAGGHARQHAWLEAVQTIGIVVLLLVSVVLMAFASLEKWSHEPRGMVAVLALGGLMVMLLAELDRRGDSLVNWLIGARSEEVVQQELASLASEGWLVRHNLERLRGGNVDHVAVGPTGAFAIETKSGPYRAVAGAQAIGAAMWLREKGGISWVTAVVCTPSGDEIDKRGNVWVIPRPLLGDWIRSCSEHRGRALDLNSIEKRLDDR